MLDALETACLIERAETALTRAVVSAALASGRASHAFLAEIGGGVAAYLRPGSPLNKVIGAGLTAPITQAALEEVETRMAACQELTRIELATSAPPEVSESLQRRRYRLLGVENVLVRSLLVAIETDTPDIRVERIDESTALAWKQTTITATAASDETGEAVDDFSFEIIADAIEDFLHTPGFERYLGLIGGVPAGAASMLIHDRVALLSGSATLRDRRLRGVQTALISARLAAARAHGAELAVVTVAPGSRSETNMLKRGFARAYARAIWIRE